jgi:hypothetical protein
MTTDISEKKDPEGWIKVHNTPWYLVSPRFKYLDRFCGFLQLLKANSEIKPEIRQ